MSQLTVTAIALLGLVVLVQLISADQTDNSKGQSTDPQTISGAQQGANMTPQSNMEQQSNMMPRVPSGQNSGQGFNSDIFRQQMGQLGQYGQYGQPMNSPPMQQMQPGQLLNGLSGAMQQMQQRGAFGQTNQNPSSGLSDLLLRLPQQGIELLQTLMSNFQCMMSRLGRNQQQTPFNQMSQAMNPGQMGQVMNPNEIGAPKNPSGIGATMNPNNRGMNPSQFGAVMNPNQMGSLGGNGLLSGVLGQDGLLGRASPLNLQGLTGGLSQGRLPNMNDVAGQFTKTVGNLGQGLQGGFSNVMPQLPQVIPA